MNRLSHPGFTAAIAMSLAAFSAGAATTDAKYKQNAAGACQGALPAFAGTLRARPLALQNEGTSTAFASCSMPHNDVNNEQSSSMGMRFINNAASSVTINCTAVDGYAGDGTPAYSAKSVVLPAGGTALIQWIPGDFGAPFIVSPNMSCALPPGAGIGYVYHWYDRQIGA